MNFNFPKNYKLYVKLGGVKILALLFFRAFTCHSFLLHFKYTRIISVIQQLAFYYYSARHKVENDSS